MFVVTNRYFLLATLDYIYIPYESPTNNFINNEKDQATKIKLLPPIFVCGISDLISFRNKLINLFGFENIMFKPTTNNLKI